MTRLRWAGAALALVGACLAALIVAVGVDHHATTVLPLPTGTFAVGRLHLDLSEPTPEPFGPPGSGRQLVVWIWYPARSIPHQAPAPYFPADWRAALASTSGRVMSDWLTRDLARVHTHSYSRVSAASGVFPVVLLRPGLGALSLDYTSLAEDLASHGYVVVSFDAAYRTGVVVLRNGNVIARPAAADPELLRGTAQEELALKLMRAWRADIGYVTGWLALLNRAPGPLAGHLDLARLGVAGHSLGGATALSFCARDARCRAGVDLDGAPLGAVIHTGTLPPFLFLLSDHAHDPARETRLVRANLAAIYSRLPPGERWWVRVRGANHFSFTDQVVVKSHVLLGAMRWARLMPLDGPQGLAITRAWLRTFFDVYLRGAPVTRLRRLGAAYPEARITLP